ncbi:ABC transporter substrate-binding protein [Bordetella pseudohinzii]|uniref:Branched-chain amino acid ABC transporter substrate-binding protein n=1 Tax=Bordetella pseudohinzii TaxID=1331258 RepID=A0A0J6BV96_9BORD|nr:ABC transporter substrate-binding protein [Bordetella pseudohinzii]ANY17466.1 branched-chain amino acid ABC transporter substrate-binding protein [Bordetella pseudohinzii]KMM25689.1 branched-chain amino acid ABC transporter substrate-binding protein [Bordetella pseudohinzii]KXA81682.1 branched-chain amino acid ABC transporter substrate-binding protein [Bordetella pseudohinzii]KXA83079.1 branched-chain amino acid ABC transporter substrate-binding protein [Bordetella pseudohinzii]CUI71747.1 R
MLSNKLSLAAAALATLLAMPALAQVKVGVVTSSTGPTALVGIPQKNSIPLLPKEIGGLSVEYISLDDASDTTASVTAFKRLITEQKVDALIGPSGSPNAMGVLQFAAEAGVPMLAPVGTAAVVLPMNDQKKWVFKTTQNDDIIARALVDHMAKSGIKTVGFIGLNDPYGENWYKVFSAMAAEKGIKITANERYVRFDTSVTGQALKILAAKPEAVLIAAPGAASVLPQATLFDQGYKGKFYQTHGAALPDFLKLGGKKVEGTILAASLMLVLPEIADSNPSKKVASDYIAAYEKLNGSKPATFGANVFDAGLLLQQAIPEAAKAGKPGTPEFRSALRDALERTKELVGTQGVYNMSPADHSGFDERGRELITVKDGTWTLVK